MLKTNGKCHTNPSNILSQNIFWLNKFMQCLCCKNISEQIQYICIISNIILCTKPMILPGNPTGYKSSMITLESLCHFTGKDATPGCGWNSNLSWKVSQWISCYCSEPHKADTQRDNAANDIPSTTPQTANFSSTCQSTDISSFSKHDPKYCSMKKKPH